MTRRQWLEAALRELAGTEAPRRTAQLLLCQSLGIDRLQLVTNPDTPVPDQCMSTLDALLARRRLGEPVAYLLGWKEFYGRPFQLTAATLIPRPETELLVDEALSQLPEYHINFADLGTGSGCLAVTLAAERPRWTGTAVDISPEALHCAEENARRFQVDDRLTFHCSSFTQPGSWQEGMVGLHLVVSNPPYISEAEYAILDDTVRSFEPKTALVPGPEGIEHLEAVVAAATHILRPGGLLLMEHGFTQGEAARALCASERWAQVETRQDLAGLDRYLFAVHR